MDSIARSGRVGQRGRLYPEELLLVRRVSAYYAVLHEDGALRSALEALFELLRRRPFAAGDRAFRPIEEGGPPPRAGRALADFVEQWRLSKDTGVSDVWHSLWLAAATRDPIKLEVAPRGYIAPAGG